MTYSGQIYFRLNPIMSEYLTKAKNLYEEICNINVSSNQNAHNKFFQKILFFIISKLKKILNDIR